MSTSQVPAPADAFLPGPILLLGAPGVGKGTQAKLLMAEFAIPQISTGDILRANIANGTPLGRSARHLMDQGQLVSDDIVNRMVVDRLALPDTARGYILDGYPRTLSQATWLDEQLDSRLGASSLPVVALSIAVPYAELHRRITGRFSCPLCGRIYNAYTNPPRVKDVCDVDGTTLGQRDDDTEAVFTERMKAFASQTAPVIDHYRRRERFLSVPGDRSVPEVAAAISAQVRSARSGGAAAWPSS